MSSTSAMKSKEPERERTSSGQPDGRGNPAVPGHDGGGRLPDLRSQAGAFERPEVRKPLSRVLTGSSCPPDKTLRNSASSTGTTRRVTRIHRWFPTPRLSGYKGPALTPPPRPEGLAVRETNVAMGAKPSGFDVTGTDPSEESSRISDKETQPSPTLFTHRLESLFEAQRQRPAVEVLQPNSTARSCTPDNSPSEGVATPGVPGRLAGVVGQQAELHARSA